MGREVADHVDVMVRIPDLIKHAVIAVVIREELIEGPDAQVRLDEGIGNGIGRRLILGDDIDLVVACELRKKLHCVVRYAASSGGNR